MPNPPCGTVLAYTLAHEVEARTSGLRARTARIALLGAMLGFAYGCVSEAQRTAPEKVMHECPVSEVGREDLVSGKSREVIENAEPKSQGGEI